MSSKNVPMSSNVVRKRGPMSSKTGPDVVSSASTGIG
jgi:hypothetical protein